LAAIFNTVSAVIPSLHVDFEDELYRTPARTRRHCRKSASRQYLQGWEPHQGAEE
jgi:hypothetical protein